MLIHVTLRPRAFEVQGTSPISFILSLWYNRAAIDPLEVNVTLLRDFIELITAQPGALVYHLVTLFAIQLIAGVAVGHWHRQHDDAATRLLVMGVGLFLARAIPMLVAVLHSVGAVSSVVVLPPLERFLQFISSVLVVWAFLPVLEKKPRLRTVLVLIITLIAAGAYAVFAWLWPEAAAQGVLYNAYWQAQAWELSTAAVLALGLVGSLAWRPPDWGWLFCLLALWLTGHSLQVASPSPGTHLAGWVRLANLAALPLLAALVYRRALGSTMPGGEWSEGRPRGALGILEAVRTIESGNGLEVGLELAADSIAQTLHADLAIVGLLVPGQTEMVRVYGLGQTSSAVAAGEDMTLPLPDHPALTTASWSLPRKRPTVVEHGTSQLKDLYQLLGFEKSGPLMVEPLVRDEEILGLLLVGNPQSQQNWSARDEQIMHAIALVLAPIIADSGAD